MAFLHILPFFFGVLSLFMALLFISYYLVKKENREDVLYITLLYFFGALVAIFQGVSNVSVTDQNIVLFHKLKIFCILFNVSILNIFINRISNLKINLMVLIVNSMFFIIAILTISTDLVLKSTIWTIHLEHINMVYRFAEKNVLYTFYSLLLFTSLFTHIIKHTTLKRYSTFKQKTALISLVLLIAGGFNDLGTLYKVFNSVLISEYVFFLIPAVYSSILIREIIQNEEQAILLTQKLEKEKLNLENRTNELLKAKKEIEGLNEISLQISKSLNIDKVFNDIVLYLNDFFGFEGCALYLCSMEDKMFSLERYSVPEKIEKYFHNKIGKAYSLNKNLGWLHESMLKNKTLFFTNIVPKEVINKFNLKTIKQLRVKSVLFTPIISEDEVIGAFSLTSHENNIYLSTEDIESIKRFVNQIAITIKNSKLYEEILRERSFSASLIENSPFAILVVDKFLNPIYTNPACVKLIGYHKSEIIEKDFFNSKEIVDSGFHKYFKQTLKGKTVYKENTILHSSNRNLDLILNVTFTPVHSQKGKVDIVLIMFYDNTEKAIAERTINEDLMLAKHIQSNYIALDTKHIYELEYDVYFAPMMEVGGDIYSVYKMDNRFYRVLIADATGHGVQAALTTMIIKAEYDKVKSYNAKPNKVLSALNNLFMNYYTELNVFFTCVLIDFDLNKNKIYYSSAGHPVQFLLKNGKTNPLQAGGRMVGILEDMDYKLRTVDFNAGDKAVFFTDGVFEVFNEKKEEFGETRLGELISNHSDKEMKLLIKNIVDELNNWRGNAPVNDDITLLVVEYK